MKQMMSKLAVLCGISIVPLLSNTTELSAQTEHRTLEELARLSWPELKCIYCRSTPGVIPCGFVRGESFVFPDRILHTIRTRMVNFAWQGKHFICEDCTVINQWKFGKAIRGEVYYGTSWLDGKPAIIIDYRQTSRVWSDARDEMREVAPGLYVGVMHRQRHGTTREKYYFVLDANPSPCRK